MPGRPKIRAPLPAAADTLRRKRSTPTGSSSSTLHSAGSSSSLTASSASGYAVPTSVLWLEQLAFTVSASKRAKSDVRYVLSVEHAKSKSSWSRAPTFDEYRHFQRRLLKALGHGHFCKAECPWLYTFVKAYFPKTCIFGVTARVIELRREALHRYLVALQTFLMNRSNHCCSVLTTAVADEVVAFVNGDVGLEHQMRLVSPSSSGAAVSGRRSWDSNACTSDDDDAVIEVHLEGDEGCEDGLCHICQSRLEVEAYRDSVDSISAALPSSPATSPSSPIPAPAPSLRKVSSVSSTTSMATGTRRKATFYTTTLRCGHQFHDECIVPKLNESMQCPTCGHAEADSS